MFMEFVRVCAPVPEFEVRIQSDGVKYLMTDIIELHKTQIVGLVTDERPHSDGNKKLVALNFNQVSSLFVPPKFEKLYLEIMGRVNVYLQKLTKGSKDALNAKPEALYNAFYYILERDGAALFREISR